ncbi:hypothetical protein Ciccas_007415 [Cichlidogyrus casuarinus]|uniref:C2H2-type domain-containing protein n=1 Tax=Cichlidogyrus casuarinus TaxID=1844966 RepID=A0ABD2Q4B3_9PLAT
MLRFKRRQGLELHMRKVHNGDMSGATIKSSGKQSLLPINPLPCSTGIETIPLSGLPASEATLPLSSLSSKTQSWKREERSQSPFVMRNGIIRRKGPMDTKKDELPSDSDASLVMENAHFLPLGSNRCRRNFNYELIANNGCGPGSDTLQETALEASLNRLCFMRQAYKNQSVLAHFLIPMHSKHDQNFRLVCDTQNNTSLPLANAFAGILQAKKPDQGCCFYCEACNNANYAKDEASDDQPDDVHMSILRPCLFHNNTFPCYLCCQHFDDKLAFKRHFRRSHDRKYFPIVVNVFAELRAFCSICHRGFHTKSQLKEHKNLQHFAPQWQCSFCKKSFNKRGVRDLHVLNAHGGTFYKLLFTHF